MSSKTSSLPPRYDQLSLRGQALTSQNAELLHYIQKLRRRRDAADAAVRADESQRASLQRELAALQRRLAELAERATVSSRARDECEGVLATAEAAYEKILQSAQSLRDVLKAEAGGGGGGGGGAGCSSRGESRTRGGRSAVVGGSDDGDGDGDESDSGHSTS